MSKYVTTTNDVTTTDNKDQQKEKNVKKDIGKEISSKKIWHDPSSEKTAAIFTGSNC